ncbi:hypothetical protein BJV74DRAFT_123799 [Russula compacta]|nr:hypothetical protein BJV74DRAFT_123799 [Russula compacta]
MVKMKSLKNQRRVCHLRFPSWLCNFRADMRCQLQLTMLTLDTTDVDGMYMHRYAEVFPHPHPHPLYGSAQVLHLLGLKTCLTSSLAPSTSQRPCKRAFILPLRLVTPFISPSLSSPRLVRVLAQHGPTPILRAAHIGFFVFAFTPVPSCPRFPAHARPPAPPRVHPLRLCPPAVRNGLSPSVFHSHLPPSTSQCPSKRAFIAFHFMTGHLLPPRLAPHHLASRLDEHGPSPVPRVVAGQCDRRTQFWFWYLTDQ